MTPYFRTFLEVLVYLVLSFFLGWKITLGIFIIHWICNIYMNRIIKDVEGDNGPS
jgi:hypothetical protein